MESFSKALKQLDLEAIRERVNSLSSTNRESGDKYSCEKCRDQEGDFYRDEQGYEYWKDCECLIRKRISKLADSSQITPEFQKKTLSNFEINGVAEKVKAAHMSSSAFVKDFHTIRKARQNSVALLGRPGCGKTHLLMGIANELISQGVEVIYFPWVEGFNELKGDFDKLEQRVNRLQKAQVLFIDDMFKGRDEPTPFQKEQAFAIINYRYLQNLPVLISSERSIADMCSIDEALGSRINEMCRDYKVTLTGGIELNYRLRD